MGMTQMMGANEEGEKVSEWDSQWNPDSMCDALSEDQLRFLLSILRYGLLSRMVKIPGGAGIVSRLVLDQVRLGADTLFTVLCWQSGQKMEDSARNDGGSA